MGQSSSKTIVIAGVVIALLAGCLGGIYMFSGAKLFQFQAESGSVSIAKAKLTAAGLVVDMYASQNGGFEGLNAQAMAAIDTSTQWVDGEPDAGQIGISDVTGTSYILTLKESGGVVYRAIKEQGKLKFQDSVGNQI